MATSDSKQSEKSCVFDSTNPDEGAWLQPNNYKIQKMTLQVSPLDFGLSKS